MHLSLVLMGFFVVTQARGLGIAIDRSLGLCALIFFTLLLHEFGHVVAAMFTRARLKLILLMPLGGVSFYTGHKGRDAEAEDRFLTPNQETTIAIAGPLTNLVIAGIAILFAMGVAPHLDLWAWPFVTSHSLLKSFVWFNILLAAINVLPAYPLDFGRILRVQFSRVRGRIDATRAAVGLSQAIAFLLTIVGLLPPMNIWLILGGSFLFLAAQVEDRSLAFHSLTDNVRIEEVMLTDFSTLSPADTLEDALYKAIHTLQDDFPVIRSGSLVGTITRQAIVNALRSGGNGYVQSAMDKVGSVLKRNETLAAAFRKLNGTGTTLLPVVDQERLVGVVTLQHLMHSLALLAEHRKRTASRTDEE
jgi:Zn-dependent protease/CBS domain-containing protein